VAARVDGGQGRRAFPAPPSGSVTVVVWISCGGLTRSGGFRRSVAR
jgi:hypothetical protein